MADNKIVVTADAAQAIEENRKLQAEIDKLEKKYVEIKEASKKAAREERESSREAKKVIESVQTAKEKFNRTQEKLNRLLAQGKINQEQYNRALANAKAKMKDAETGMNKLKASFTSFATNAFATAGVIAALQKVIELSREVRKETAQTATSIDTMNREFMVQAGLTNLEGKESRKNILQVVEDNASTPEIGFNSARQLVSSGFSSDDAEGAGLDIFLKAMSSGNMSRMDPAAIIQAASQSMAAFGMEKNAKNFENVLVRMRGLFQGTDVQVGDLGEFARAMPALSQANVSFEDSLSGLTLLRESMAPGEAATQMRNVVQNLQTAGASDAKTEVLASMGLTPADVDLVGESLDQVLERFRQALLKLDPEDRVSAQAKLVEKANVGAFNMLLSGKDRMNEFDAMQRDRAGFNRGVQIAQAGPQAVQNRMQVQEIRRSLENEEEALRIEQEADQLNKIDAERYRTGNFMQNLGWLAATKLVRDPAIGLFGMDRRGFMSEEAQRQLDVAQGVAPPEMQAPIAQPRIGGAAAVVGGNQEIMQQQTRIAERQAQLTEQLVTETVKTREAVENNRPRQQNPIERMPVGGQ